MRAFLQLVGKMIPFTHCKKEKKKKKKKERKHYSVGGGSGGGGGGGGGGGYPGFKLIVRIQTCDLEDSSVETFHMQPYFLSLLKHKSKEAQ